MTLHNQALAIAATDPPGCMERLINILDEPTPPPTTVPNLLTLYCK